LPNPAAPMDSPNPAHIDLQLTHIPFQDPESAKLHFARVARQLSPALATALPALLAEAADPDSAILLLDRFVNECAEVIQLLNRHNFLAHYAIVVFGHSRFLGETLIQNPDLLQSFLREKNLDRSFSREEFHEALARFRSRSFETDVSLLLARFKRREYVRIMLRDVLKIAPLAETTAEISALADVLIEDALREAERRLQRRYSTPQHLDAERRLVDTPFAILALGKLGGNELNYSSDVDLTYIFDDGDEAPTATISNREFFIRLAQQVTEILSHTTREGPPFRIDLRLRPQGAEGELAISLSQALHYYQTIAHDWEQQALIKLRYSAGDAALAREFIRAVQPYVYTEKVNFAAIKTALVARERMQKHRRRGKALQQSDDTVDVKIDSGGIRDIEFLVQCLQRVYGGREPWLRSGGTLFSLHKLHDKRHISGKEFHELTSAYEFLRHLEHRLQLRHGQQTHRLPASSTELQIAQRSMEGRVPGADRLSDLANLVRSRMRAVAEIYRRIIYHQQVQEGQEPQTTEFQLTATLEASAGDSTGQQMLERLAADAPPLYQAAIRRGLAAPAKRNLLRFFSSMVAASDRYAVVLRHAQAAERVLQLFETSEYLAEILVRHPEEIAALAELKPAGEVSEGRFLFADTLHPETRRDPVFQYLATSPASFAEKLSLLRQHFRHRVFASVARDVIHPRPVYESFAATTTAAEDAIAAAFVIAGAPSDLAVLALGRLGTGEFDILSDADLLFICTEDADRQSATKAAERMMQALAAYTQEGMVFPVDARLRPRGGEGELLVSPTQLAAYFEHEAQEWEALMYTKLRYLIGNHSLVDRTTQALPILFNRFAADENFISAVREMRSKLESAEAPEKTFKTSAGGTYDIDFLANSLFVKHNIANKQGTLRDRLWRCAESGALEKCDAAALDHAAELLRTTEHAVRFVTGRAHKWLPATEHGRRAVEELTSKILRTNFEKGLEAELDCTCRNVRTIYERVLVSLAPSN
jgi:[glutamine synthetase] adenylyltransferase / [glutamine synthetase]-adenylyl-L-tyrosine phosphorylase